MINLKFDFEIFCLAETKNLILQLQKIDEQFVNCDLLILFYVVDTVHPNGLNHNDKALYSQDFKKIWVFMVYYSNI